MSAPIPPDNHDWKAEYLRQVDLHNQTLDELREAEMQLRNPAPIPPEQTGDALVEGMYQKMWKDFVSLQRGDAKQICVEAELYRKSLTAPIPPTVPDTNLETATNRNYLESIGQLPPTEGSKP